ncbi:MAG: TonB-dependent receptor [Marinilabiliales bacterium]|nr:MAG: TonB-dependent receptor [Marinilabiliales bacterium]
MERKFNFSGKCRRIVLLAILCTSFTALQAQTPETTISGSWYGKTVRQILLDISNNYGFILDLDYEDLPSGIQKGRTIKNKPVGEALEIILDGHELNYKVVEDRILIRPAGTAITYTAPVYERKSDFTLQGQIVEAGTGETLPFAQIIVEGTTNGAVTNVDGHFTLFHVPSDTCFLIVSYIGYKSQYFRLSPKIIANELRIEMIPEARTLTAVEVFGEKEEKLLEVNSVKGMVSMSPKQIVALPSIGDKDIFRSFQLLPGISGSNESSSGLYVRGGTPDQNLVLYDGFTVYHVDHLFGMFSAFNPDGIKNVQMSKGGFESKFGGRLSSVMEITGKDGNETQFNAGAAVSLLSFSGFVEVPLAGKGALFVSGRKSFESALYDKIFDQFNTSDEPEVMQGMGRRMMQSVTPSSYFYDINAKATYKPTSRDELSWSFYNGQDDLDNSRDNNFARAGFELSGSNSDLTSWGNWGSSLKWSRRWSETFFSNLTGSFSNYYSVRDRRSVMVRDDEEVTRGSYENNQLFDYSLKLENEFKTGQNNQIDFGLQASYITIDYLFNINDSLDIQDTYNAESKISAYITDDWMIWDKVNLKPGIRATYYTGTNKVYYEPRFSARYHFTDQISLNASWGKYYQFANRIVREDLESGSRDFWMLADDETIPVSSATHYIAGLTWENHDFLAEVNGFYKPMNGLTEYTLRFVPTFGMEMSYDEYFYEGNGIAKGIECLLQKKLGDYTGWLGYTYTDVDYRFDIYGDDYFPASHDATHEFKVVNSYKMNDWTFSATWIYATGKPYTPPLGAYQIENPDGSYTDCIVVGDKNSFRLPDYHRLDVSATYNYHIFDKTTGNIGFSLFNAYNRENVWYKEFEVVDGELLETNVNLLGITPNITFSLKLK